MSVSREATRAVVCTVAVEAWVDLHVAAPAAGAAGAALTRRQARTVVAGCCSMVHHPSQAGVSRSWETYMMMVGQRSAAAAAPRPCCYCYLELPSACEADDDCHDGWRVPSLPSFLPSRSGSSPLSWPVSPCPCAPLDGHLFFLERSIFRILIATAG